MKNPWFTIFTLLVDEFIPLVEHVFEFINSFSESRSYFTFTWVDVPIPTDWLGTIFNVMNSPLSRPWAVESPIVDTTLSNLDVIWLKLLLKEYSKLLEPTFVSPTNDKPDVFVVKPTCVTIPIKLSDFLITNTSWVFPDSGMLNVVTPSSFETVKAYPAFGFVKVILWLVVNGWFGNLILWSGVETTFVKSPKVDNDVEPNPTTVPTPIDSWGLKNISSFIFESNSVMPIPELSKVNLFERTSTWVPTVWTPDTAPLFTLKILLTSNLLRTFSFSVPIPILLPIEICSGILDTYMSVTTPVVAELGISW